MTPKQQAFVDAYQGQAKGNATEASRLAGYRHPNKQGPRLLVNDGIREAIGDRPTSNPAIADPEGIRRFWTETMKDDSQGIRDRLRSSELLAKSMGMFLDRQEVTGRDGAPVEMPTRIIIGPPDGYAADAVKGLTTEELRALIAMDDESTH